MFQDTTRREDDQREFDRVSEALHYMSHAQHAISDLMLDLSSASPRHLCCRPILIEQSAFVNTGIPPPSGDILLAMGGMGAPWGPADTVPIIGGAAPAPAGGTAPGTPRRVISANQPPNASRLTPHHHHLATIPILVQQTHNGLPTMEQLHQSAAAAAAAALNSNGIQELIQSIVNAAPMATIEVQRGNEPPITINVPPPPHPPPAGDQQPTEQSQSEGGAGGAAPATNNNGRTTSATTMPTTSTQTRSTARPQVHVTSIQQPNEMRNPRPFPSSAFSAFDRYLPCNSHHVRDQQARAQGQPVGATGIPVGGPPAGAAGNRAAATGEAAAGRENVIRIPHGRIEIPLGFPFQLRRRPTSVSNSRSASQERPASAQAQTAGRSGTPSDELEAVYNSTDPDEEFVMQTRDELVAFVVKRFFRNADITVDNIKEVGGIEQTKLRSTKIVIFPIVSSGRVRDRDRNGGLAGAYIKLRASAPLHPVVRARAVADSPAGDP